MARRESDPARGKRYLKVLDRYFGIPLVYLFGAFRRKKTSLPQFSSLGLLVTGATGDTILLSGVLADLRTCLPAKQILLFTTGSNHEAGKLLASADRVVELSITDPIRALRILRNNKVDVFCDFGSWQRLNALYTYFSGARFSIGFRTAGQYRHYSYDWVVDHSDRVHEIENYRALVRLLGIHSTELPKITVNVPLIRELKPKAYLVFHAWSGGYKGHLKEWPERHWLDLGRRTADLGLEIVLTGAPYNVRRTQELCSRMSSVCARRVLNLAGRITLAETAKILEHAAAVISVNTGIVHLASAVGAPVISLNGPVPGRRWGPLGEQSISVDSEVEGCGYLNLGFEYENQREDCMDLISPERVISLIEKLLNTRAQPAP